MRTGFDLQTFLKAQASSLAATVVDFSVTFLLVEFFRINALPASISGTISGGITNFLIGRFWVFEGRGKKTMWQVVRYLLVWNGNLLLNASGFYLLNNSLHLNYILSKVIVSLAVGFGYNYILQKRFVFK